jgi:hypothetical protein
LQDYYRTQAAIHQLYILAATNAKPGAISPSAMKDILRVHAHFVSLAHVPARNQRQ